MRILLPIAATLATVTTPAIAAAPTPMTELVEVRIDLASFDLTNADDRAKLEQSIDAKLRMACTAKPSTYYHRNRAHFDAQCFADARKAAMKQVERAALAGADSSEDIVAN